MPDETHRRSAPQRAVSRVAAKAGRRQRIAVPLDRRTGRDHRPRRRLDRPGSWPISRRITGCSACGRQQAQDEIWGASPDNLVGSALIFPRGRAKKVEGGYRVTGRWPFSSGVDPVGLEPRSARSRRTRRAAAPSRASSCCRQSDYTIIDTWHVIGLSGTGSKDVVGRGRVRAGLPHPGGRPDHRRPQSGQQGQPGGAVPAAGDQPVRVLHRRRVARDRRRGRSSISPRRPARGSAIIPAATSPISTPCRCISPRPRRSPMRRAR